jgi:cell division protein FtsB
MNDGNLRFVRALRTLFDSQNVMRRRLIWLAVLGLALIIFLFVFGGNYGVFNIIKLNRERRTLQKEIESLEKERNDLRTVIEKLKYDRREIEKVARENYGMARPGEKVVKFVAPQDTGRRP